MPSVMAIVSKAVFDKEARGLRVGQVWTTDRYVSQNKGLAPLEDEGDLYLVTVRPPDEALWLVGILRRPKRGEEMWQAAANEVPITDISARKGALRFANGVGLSAKPGALGMSLQTPRVLIDADIACLQGGASMAAPAKPAPAKPAPAKPAPEKVAAAAVTPVAAPATLDADPRLSRALEHLRADRAERALYEVLEAWRVHRAPSIAALLEAVSHEVDRCLPKLRGLPEDSRTVPMSWLEVAGRRRAADVGRLLASLGGVAIKTLKDRFDRLVALAPDPRLPGPMMMLAADYRSFDAGKLLTTSFEVASRTNDPRSAAMIDGLLGSLFVPVASDSDAYKEHLAKYERRARRARENITAPPPLPPAIEAQVDLGLAECSRLAKRTDVPRVADSAPPETQAGSATSRSLDDLLSAVLADFEDDELLAIYSDALQQANDPRGELIALQLERARLGKPASGAAEKRERELMREHGREWIAPLDLLIKPGAFRFERGFLASCVVDGGTGLERSSLAGHRLWSTVRELECADMAFATHPVFKGVRRGVYSASALDVLAKRDEPISLEAVMGELMNSYGIPLRVGMPLATPEAWGAALDVGALTSLRSLQIRNPETTPERLRFLLETKLGAQLREIDLFHPPPLATWLSELRARPGDFRLRLRFTNRNTAAGTTAILASFDVTRAASGDFDVDVTFNNEMVELQYLTMPRQLGDFLQGLSSRHHLRARVRYSGSKKRTTMGYPAIAPLLQKAFEELTLE